MEGFNFASIGGRGNHKSNGKAVIWLINDRLNLGTPVYERLGRPSRVLVSYDVRNKALRIEPGRPDRGEALAIHQPTKGGGSTVPFCSISLKRFGMPTGIYHPIDTSIFIHESLQR